jgi:hypothetical protein
MDRVTARWHDGCVTGRMSMSDIDWEKIAAALPKTAHDLLDTIRAAYESGGDDPAREVELALKEQIAGLHHRLEELGGGGS